MIPEKGRQIEQRLGNVIFIVEHRHHSYSVQRIIKKMRIYLTLQHSVFSLGLAFFRFGNGIYEVVELARQTVEIIEKVAEFILSFL